MSFIYPKDSLENEIFKILFRIKNKKYSDEKGRKIKDSEKDC